ncbi:MAG: ribosome recycling factor [Chlamydiales bacterium]
MSVTDEIKAKMRATVDHFKQDLKGLRSNRANPAMVENVMVEVYGSNMRLKELANISAPEPRQLLISPFDPQTAAPIAKSIEKANLNIQPIVEGQIIRISIPPMDESMRKEIAKQGKKKAEEAKIVVRDIRRKGNEQARTLKADGTLTEDMLKKAEKMIQEFTDQFCKEIDDLFTQKEREIMTV